MTYEKELKNAFYSDSLDDSKPIPSEKWIRLQFWPRNPYATSALRYTGKFKVKYAVQSHQMRKSHPDSSRSPSICKVF